MQVYVRQPKPPTDAASAPHHPPLQGNIPQKLILKDILLVSLKNLTDLVFLPFSLPKIVFVPTSFFQAVQVSYWQDALTNELIALEAKSNMGIRASSYQCLCN